MSKLETRATRFAPATDETVAAAAQTLREGGLVAMPTETVYGLAGLATSDAAVAAIYAAKGRPSFNPLIAHFADLDAAYAEARLDERAKILGEAFWPGPLTIVAPAPFTRVSLLARAGLDTLALRVPAHEVARALIAAAGAPLVAPSANRSGRVSPTTAEHVAEELSERERLEAALDEAVEEERAADGAPIAPGMLRSHYSPRASLRLFAKDIGAEEAGLDFAGVLQGSDAALRLDLSPSGDLVEAAANLFSFLRRLDAEKVETIAVAPIPMIGLGAAINDRLARAAAPKS